jgi:hypothetical protein
MSVELTPGQARSLADLAAREGVSIIHQVVGDHEPSGSDVFVTPQGTSDRYRIAAHGTGSSIGETLPVGSSPHPRTTRLWSCAASNWVVSLGTASSIR